MAKVRSILKLSGTLSKLTFVDSKAYGPHVRAERGSNTAISLAEGMKKSSVVQTQVNLMAKIVFDAINEFAPGFKDGKLWSRLLSVFRQQKKAGKSFSYSGFSGMEMRIEYATSKHGSFQLAKSLDKGLLVYYNLRKNTSYRLRVLRIAVDETMLQAYPHETLSVDLNEGDKSGSLQLNFTELPAGSDMLYVLHCEQLVAGQPADLLQGKGVRLLWA